MSQPNDETPADHVLDRLRQLGNKVDRERARQMAINALRLGIPPETVAEASPFDLAHVRYLQRYHLGPRRLTKTRPT